MKFFSFISLILFIGVIPAFPFVYADSLEDIDKNEIETQCRTGQVLVFRTINNDYICTTKSTSDYLEYIDKHEIETQCRTGQVLVFHTIYNDYICTAKSTAVTWVQRSMALLVDVDTKELVGIWEEPEQKSIVECQDGLLLIFKFSDNSPACVKPDTKQKLIKRGWASSQL